MKKILFVTWKRNDAIGIVDDAVKKELQNFEHNFVFLELYEKGKNIFSIFYNYTRSSLKLLWHARKYRKIYFSRENPFVIFVHFFYPQKEISMTVHHVEDYRGKSQIGELILKSTNRFIAISEFTKQQLMELNIKEEKIFVNYNGISGAYYPEIIKDFKPFPYILYVGTEIPRKNTDTLLEAFEIVHKKYPDIKLVKIGNPGTKEAQLNFDKKVKKLRLEEAVIIKRAFISDDELRKWYSNAICYVSVSKLEGFGLTIPEAMACGCPVIASDICPFREICENSQILVNPMNKDSIFKGIERYMNDGKFRNSKVKEGIEKAKKFNWQKNVKMLIQLFYSK